MLTRAKMPPRRQAEEATAAADAFTDVSEHVSLFALPQTGPAPTEDDAASEAVETTPEPTPVTGEKAHPTEKTEAREDIQTIENMEETPIPEEAQADGEEESAKDAEEDPGENTVENAEEDGDGVPLG